MKLIIAGSRDYCLTVGFIDELLMENNLDELLTDVTEVVSGGANGVDKSGESWADDRDIPIRIFKPDWNMHGKAAGPIRNREMAEYADALLLIWDGKSRGSASMKREMRKLDKPIYEFVME